jgi:hypothetical protein
MISKATIETRRDGEELIVSARYWTPDWVRFIETIWWPLTLFGWAGASIIAFRVLIARNLSLTINEAIFWGAILSATMFALSWGANRALARIGGGYGLARKGRSQLTVRLARGHIAWQGESKNGAIDREGWPVRFVPRPHRSGRLEQRDAESSQNVYPLSYAYRNGWEIWLQVGERFFALAAVSSEADVDAIVRRLQAADLEVTRPRQGARRSA